MPGEPARVYEPEDAACVDDEAAVKAADATSLGDREPGHEEIELDGDEES
jgi:hypothetical protein